MYWNGVEIGKLQTGWHLGHMHDSTWREMTNESIEKPFVSQPQFLWLSQGRFLFQCRLISQGEVMGYWGYAAGLWCIFTTGLIMGSPFPAFSIELQSVSLSHKILVKFLLSHSLVFARFWTSRSLEFFAKPMWALNLGLAIWRPQKVSVSQRKTLVSPSCKVSHLPITTPSYQMWLLFFRTFRIRR